MYEAEEVFQAGFVGGGMGTDSFFTLLLLHSSAEIKAILREVND